MDREQGTSGVSRSRLMAVVLGFALGLIAMIVYWLRRREETEMVRSEQGARLRVQVPPRPREPEPDDLTRIEGVGPKLASLLRSAGISTYRGLAQSTADELRAILHERRLYFADPTTWPEQAELAAVEAWGALSDLQEELTAGRRS